MKAITPLLLAICLAFAIAVNADELTPISVNCLYDTTVDDYGSTWVTETCTTTYSNGTSSVSSRTFLSLTDCWQCMWMPEVNNH